MFHDVNNEVEGIYFQDSRMKSYFENYPDLLMFDGTYSLNDRRMPLVILLVVDGNGDSQIAAFFIVKSENTDVFNFLFENFKNENPNHVNINVILTDKGGPNRNVVEAQFPNIPHHFCLFHVAQNFMREITTKKRGINSDQRKMCLEIVNKMIYAKSQEEYDNLYAELRDTGCAGN